MPEAVIVGVLSLVGTLIGTLGGIIASSKLVNFRLEALERKVQAHNNLVERMYKVEGDIKTLHAEVDNIRRAEQ